MNAPTLFDAALAARRAANVRFQLAGHYVGMTTDLAYICGDHWMERAKEEAAEGNAYLKEFVALLLAAEAEAVSA